MSSLLPPKTNLSFLNKLVILNEVKDLSDHGPLPFRTGRKPGESLS
jgi:hypothetical protein